LESPKQPPANRDCGRCLFGSSSKAAKSIIRCDKAATSWIISQPKRVERRAASRAARSAQGDGGGCSAPTALLRLPQKKGRKWRKKEEALTRGKL